MKRATPYKQGVDEQEYMRLADRTFRQLFDMFEDVDAEEVDVESAGDVITLAYANGERVVVNTQRPARQIWLAGGDRAWHFSWDPEREAWLDDRGSGAELLGTLIELTRTHAGIELTRPA